MGRPTTKQELLTAAQTQYDKLMRLIGSMTPEERDAPFSFGAEYTEKEAHWSRDQNIRDVLVHLYEWHLLLLRWISANTGGNAQSFLPAPYHWGNYAQMNVGFWEKHQSTPYAQAETLLNESHTRVVAQIEQFSDEALFSRAYFSWTGSTTLGAYCVSATSSHYDWAMKKIKAHLKKHRK